MVKNGENGRKTLKNGELQESGVRKSVKTSVKTCRKLKKQKKLGKKSQNSKKNYFSNCSILAQNGEHNRDDDDGDDKEKNQCPFEILLTEMTLDTTSGGFERGGLQIQAVFGF